MSFVLIKLDLSKMFHIALSVRCVHSYSMPPAQPTRWWSPNFIISDFVKMHMNSNIDHEFPAPFGYSRPSLYVSYFFLFFPIFCKIDPIGGGGAGGTKNPRSRFYQRFECSFVGGRKLVRRSIMSS